MHSKQLLCKNSASSGRMNQMFSTAAVEWSGLLCKAPRRENVHRGENGRFSSVESTQDLEFPRAIHQSSDLRMLERVQMLDENASFERPLFQGDEMKLEVEKVTEMLKPGLLHDPMKCATATLSDIEMWCHDHDSVPQNLSMNAFASEIEMPPPLERLRHIKHVYPTTYTWSPMRGNKSPLWLHGSGVDTLKVSCQASERPPQMLEYGNSPQYFDLYSLNRDITPQLLHTTDLTSSLHYVQQYIKAKPFHDAAPSNSPGIKWNREEVPDKTLDSKRNIASINSCDSSPEGIFKRPRLVSTPPTILVKARKEKLGDRITVLQQLVSPFGKTDTASVLHETIGYIKFLQDQVQVLSTPYVKTTSKTAWKNEPGNKQRIRDKDRHFHDQHKQDLKSRGLCLVPVSCTLQVLNDNGADYWASPSSGGCT